MDHNRPKSLGPASVARAKAMLARDRWSALALLALLWATMIYIYAVVPHGFLQAPIGIVLTISGALLLMFNTSSVFAMLAHYREDLDHIYGQDLRNLDLNRRRLREVSLRPAHVDTDPGAP
jgi:hypothetical protein